MLNKLCLVLVAGLLVLSGCGADAEEKDQQEDQAKEETKDTLYEEGGLVVSNVSGWSIGKEKKEPLTVNFNHQDLKAIATVVETEKDFNQIKDELLAGAGDVEVIEEQEESFSYQTKNKESIRTDVYLEQDEEQTLILSFLSKTNVYEDVKETIEEFQSAVELQK
ncbi:hypothetical protein [Aquisalibacillus elongatus]|uniref:DUF1795 domain-containing protein n=1 Tax=Aquisalibacillus elongatus TaxID=485577 RepID=A0A3N5BTZ1_9BACI|nr:hypothetical protein [Aquisalibacillus elongatus]RPF53248.1 hypothetical protein EDC24_1745 [Aquisalibacillus elongatus]